MIGMKGAVFFVVMLKILQLGELDEIHVMELKMIVMGNTQNNRSKKRRKKKKTITRNIPVVHQQIMGLVDIIANGISTYGATGLCRPGELDLGKGIIFGSDSKTCNLYHNANHHCGSGSLAKKRRGEGHVVVAGRSRRRLLLFGLLLLSDR